MCQDTISVTTIDNERSAYEVQQYLIGLPFVDDCEVDFLTNRVWVEHDDDIPHERILDEIEHAGCTPEQRVTGVIDTLKHRVGGVMKRGK